MSGNNNMEEAVFLVDNKDFLHLKETEDGYDYAVFNIASRQKEYAGEISWGEMLDCPIRSPMAAARYLAIQDVGLDGEVVSKAALSSLAEFRDSEVRRRQLFNPETMPEHDIRFIDSHYNELFRIPDGGVIEVEYPDRHFSARCEYLDDYHTRISGEVYHICQFAEILERGGGTCRPEAEIQETEAAWRIGYRNYLTVQSCESSWDYTLYDKDFHQTDGGQLDDPALSILEARDMILQNHGMENRSRFPERYEFITEKAEEISAEEMAASRKSALEELSQLKGKSSPAAEHPKRKQEQAL